MGKPHYKYPGQLGKRRRPTQEQILKAGFERSLGRASSPSDLQISGIEDYLENPEYYERGYDLIAEHFKLERSCSGGLAPGNAFWYFLAMRLLQGHVQYFMPPTRRSAPSTLQARFPGLEKVHAMIKEGRAPQLTFKEVCAVLGRHMGHKCDPPWATVEREFYKWRNSRKGVNSTK